MLTSISGYDHRTFDTLADQDRSPDGTIFLLKPRAPGSSPRRLLMQTLSGTKEKRDAISQELRLQSTGDSFLNWRSEEHTSELQSLMRTSYAVFCLKKNTHTTQVQ